MHNIFMIIALSLTTIFVPYFSLSAAEEVNEKILVQDNSAFAMDLYQKLRSTEGNLFFSPYSISTALVMTYAGAKGKTEMEMAKTLRFSLNQKNLHPAFAQVKSRLDKLQQIGNIKLSVANSLWPQHGYEFLDEYLSLIKKYYGVSITAVDYNHACEAARKTINDWVEEKTQDKIKNLIQPGLLSALTKLVLVNAIYFKGDWEKQFKADETKDATFYISSDKTVQVPMMTQKEQFKYADLESFEMLELLYAGSEVSMIVLLPKKNEDLAQLESSLSPENLAEWNGRLRRRDVVVLLPVFKMISTFRLDDTLIAMGMVDAFNDSKANFSGMDGNLDLYIGAVIHKAFIDVNEAGTEAAAATAVVMNLRGMASPPPVVFNANRPFVFLIQENKTGSVLFMGRVANPADTGI